jgi:hypothetical protein
MPCDKPFQKRRDFISVSMSEHVFTLQKCEMHECAGVAYLRWAFPKGKCDRRDFWRHPGARQHSSCSPSHLLRATRTEVSFD